MPTIEQTVKDLKGKCHEADNFLNQSETGNEALHELLEAIQDYLTARCAAPTEFTAEKMQASMTDFIASINALI